MKERVNKIDKEKPVLPRITKELDGYVGFANFPNQVYRKAIKKGFEFTLMVVGECIFVILCVCIYFWGGAETFWGPHLRLQCLRSASTSKWASVCAEYVRIICERGSIVQQMRIRMWIRVSIGKEVQRAWQLKKIEVRD